MANDHVEHIRIVQETVAGKEITFAHVMGGPAPIIYQKLGSHQILQSRVEMFIWDLQTVLQVR